MSFQPLWLTYFIEIILVLEFQITNFIVGTFSYKSHFRPQISSNDALEILKRFRMIQCKAMTTPMASNLKLLSDASSESVDAMMYR